VLGENIEIAIGIAIGIEHLARPSRKQNTGNRRRNDPDPDIDSDLEGEKTFGMGLQRNE